MSNILAAMTTMCFMLLLLLILSSITVSQAKQLDAIGEIYPIIEMDFIEFIQARVKALQQEGLWQSIQNNMQQRAITYRDRPNAVRGLSKALRNYTWLFDPSIVLDHNIVTPDGKLIASAGKRVNPLMHINLTKTLLFFDGDDAKQVAWIRKQEKKLHGRTKLILVNGSLLDQEKQLQKPVFFDQAGQLTHRFGISHVPAMVMQEGVQLRMREVAV